VINTSKKDEFVAAFRGIVKPEMQGAYDQDPGGFLKANLKAVTVALNSHPDVRRLFREAVEEARGTPEDEAAAGLSKLFSGM